MLEPINNEHFCLCSSLPQVHHGSIRRIVIPGFGLFQRGKLQQNQDAGQGTLPFKALIAAPAPASTYPLFLYQGPGLRAIFLLPVRIFHVELCHNIRRQGSLVLRRSTACEPSCPSYTTGRVKVDTHGLTPVALAKEVYIYLEGCMPSNSL